MKKIETGISNLRSRIIIAVSVSSYLPFSSYVMIGNSFPPNSWLSQSQLRQFVHDIVLAVGVEEIDTNRWMIALDEINEIKHTHEGDLQKKNGKRRREKEDKCYSNMNLAPKAIIHSNAIYYKRTQARTWSLDYTLSDDNYYSKSRMIIRYRWWSTMRPLNSPVYKYIPRRMVTRVPFSLTDNYRNL